ncbi:hypothetical protein IF1G_01025 [Cordyceps javanica]|uniref:Uncharacterized protein n=1 Tax=Cordyceps javanica TaxID=43265 RepID=A0A545VH94_9HYPO|nr:hypothetical protein IF1G_01025 [Cordyceps javanica]
MDAESAYVACAENISLLRLFHEIPEPPSANIAPAAAQHASSYTLPFATERSLVGALAFLSSITGDSHCVTAVCVQEQPGDDHRLEARVAINKKTHKEKNATLDTICRGFNQIFARLAGPGDGRCEDDVFEQIISLCKPRILRRLGSEKKNTYKGKNPLDTVLDRARDSLVKLQRGTEVPKMETYRQKAPFMNAQILQFIDKSAELLRIIRSWQRHQTDAELTAVMFGLCDFVTMDEWQAVIDLIPERLMEGSMRRSLIDRLKKGARYRHAARILYRAAKKHPIARRMEAVAVRLPESAFQRPAVPPPPATLEAACSRILLAHQARSVGRLCQALHRNAADARGAFGTQTRKTLVEGKFHAEVQLLGYILEQQPLTTAPPPRVVCASKDACFLCHCLLRAHAKLYTPRCHGKLYTEWRLPPTPAFRPLQRALNRILELKIQSSAAALLGGGGGGGLRRLRIYPDCCESTCSTAMLSNTTVVATKHPIHQAAAAAAWRRRQRTTHGSSSSSGSGSDEHWSVRQSYALAQGEVVASSLPADAVSALYTAEPLRVQLEYTGTGQRRHLRYRIQQLTAPEARALRESSYVPVIDVSLMGAAAEERTFRLDELADLYLGAGDCIFRLVLQPALQGLTD